MASLLPSRWETERLLVYVTPDDECDRLQKIYQSSYYLAPWTGIDSNDMSPDYVRRCRDGEFVPARISRERFQFMSIARKSDKELLGLLHFLQGYPDENILYIGFLFLRPSDQRHGYGAEVLDELMRIAKASAYSSSRLTVHLKNWPALRFWIRHGFTNICRVLGDENHSENTFAEIEISRPL